LDISKNDEEKCIDGMKDFTATRKDRNNSKEREKE
jgi:hypothetical protein